MKIKKQTLGGPLLETFLYISVFGAALGSRIKELHGIEYIVFVIPGLIMMAFATNAFTNNSSSILQQKFLGAIHDQLSSPASPRELLLAFCLGGFVRGLIVATLTFIVSIILTNLTVDHALVLIPSIVLVGFFFANLGVLIGVRAEQFDDVAFAQTFILQPLIFLGGVFYSASLLPQPLETLTKFDPVYYMISLVRYGFVGFTEVNIPLALGALTLATAALFLVNLRLFQRGYKLRSAEPACGWAALPRRPGLTGRMVRLSRIAGRWRLRIRRRRTPAAQDALAQDRDPDRARGRRDRRRGRDRRRLGAEHLPLGAAAEETSNRCRRAAPRRSTPPKAS